MIFKKFIRTIIHEENSNGNVLFLILIAVVLFAALSYAVTQSNRSGGSEVTERELLKGAVMAQYGISLRTSVQRMIISGVSAEDIEMHTAGGNWIPCNTGDNCIFSPEGGGITPSDLAANPDVDEYGNIWNYFQPSDGIDIGDMGTPAADMLLARHIKFNEPGRKLCMQINNGLGISGIPSASTWADAAPTEGTACVANGTDYYVWYMVFYEL